jgi:hypothetical protein
MNKRILPTTVLLLAGWTAAQAQTAAVVLPDRTGTSLNNIAIVQQLGLRNEANTLQLGPLNGASTLQNGNDNLLNLTQSHAGGAAGNTASIAQVGDFNIATISLTNTTENAIGNSLTLSQFSNASDPSQQNEVEVTVSGSANTLAMEQGTSVARVSGNSITVPITGNANDVVVKQFTNLNTARLAVENSNNNEATVEQKGGPGNFLDVVQTGAGSNVLSVVQDGTDTRVVGIEQGGVDLPGLQSGFANVANLAVTGVETVVRLQQVGNNNNTNGTVTNTNVIQPNN